MGDKKRCLPTPYTQEDVSVRSRGGGGGGAHTHARTHTHTHTHTHKHLMFLLFLFSSQNQPCFEREKKSVFPNGTAGVTRKTQRESARRYVRGRLQKIPKFNRDFSSTLRFLFATTRWYAACINRQDHQQQVFIYSPNQTKNIKKTSTRPTLI